MTDTNHRAASLQQQSYWFLCVPRFFTEYGKRSFSDLAPTVWNGLPLNIRLSPIRHLQTPSENPPFQIALMGYLKRWVFRRRFRGLTMLPT